MGSATWDYPVYCGVDYGAKMTERITYEIIGGFSINLEKKKLFHLVKIRRITGWYVALVLPHRKLLSLRKFADRGGKKRENDDEYMRFL